MQKLPKLPVIEIFGPTIQGEGLMSGTVTHFLRTGGCGLKCTWCDSMYAVDPREVKANRTMMTIADIYQFLLELPPAPYVTLTGGDPCLQKHLGDLIRLLNVEGIRVAIETQGQLFPEWLEQCDVITFSPKGPSSGNVVDAQGIYDWMNVHHVRPFQVCIKIVVFDQDDFEYAMEVYDDLPPSMYDSFYLSAGTSLNGGDMNPDSRIASVLHSEQQLAQWILHACHMGKQFNDKFHIGCQQHVLLWPKEHKGV